MKYNQLYVWLVVFSGMTCMSTGAFAQPPNYQLVTTIKVPGGLAGYDINWVDPGSERYYLADRGGGGRIDVVDTRNLTLLYTIPSGKNEIGFAGTVPSKVPGCSLSGPNGVVAIPQLNQLYVGDGDSTVKVVDLGAKAVVATIPTGGSCRADELAFDPVDRIVMIANDQESPPFLTFISTDTLAVLGRLTYPVNQIGQGLEQPVWNPKNDRFYQAVPGTNRIDVINPITMQVERSFPTKCSPAGLVLTPSQRLMTSCGEALDALSGNSIAWQNNAAADQLWYNPGDNIFYFGFFGASAVVDASSNQLLTYIPASTHSLAADPNYNRIFIPVSGKGIQVWAAK